MHKIFIGFVVIVTLFVAYFFWVRKLDNDVLNKPGAFPSTYTVAQPVLLPSVFLDSERFYIRMATVTGDTLLGYGDSGGGMCMIDPDAVARLKLKDKLKTCLVRGIIPVKCLPFAALVTDKNIPPPQPSRVMVLRSFMSAMTEPYLLIPPENAEIKMARKVQPFDVFFGQGFFMGRAWTFDYPKQQVWVNTPLTATDSGVQRIGFKKTSSGEKAFGHASTQIVVDGEILDMLFDTGATIIPSDSGKAELHTQAKTIAGSFIAASVFDNWRKKHPEWKYYPHADLKQDVIEVPVVTIGGHDVGPVLFASRPDENWSQGMIQSMDKVVKGAIGGSALRYLKVTIDYNNELIRFEK